MIYARLLGGLGNQLFQYAAGRALACRRGTELVLDVRDANRKQERARFALDHFAIAAKRGVDLPPDRRRPLAYFLWRYGGGRPRFLREQGLGLNPGVLSAADDTYLHGYFQSERYFEDVSEVIRQDLRIVTPPSDANVAALQEIADAPISVSVHVRRGDYVEDEKGGTTHGTCGARYYAAALAEISERTNGDISVFVFSDDPEWARNNLDTGATTHVFDHNGPMQHYEDLRLMSACQHHVIANSTFSWWGAWLNPRPEKIVVAPRQWFARPSLANPDILPKTWTAIGPHVA